MKSLVFSAKLLLAFAVLATAKPPHPLSSEQQAARDTCLKELGLNEDTRFDSRESAENRPNFGCFMACIGKQLGRITAEGNINKEEAVKDFPPFVPEENRTAIVDACSKKKGADTCETAKLYRICVMKMMPRPPMNPEFKKIHDGCKEKLHLTDDDLEKMRESTSENKKDCFLTCIGKASGFLNEDETLNAEKFIEKLPPHLKEEGQNVAEDCAKIEPADECETVVLLQKCFKKINLKFGDLHGHPHPPPPHHD